MINSIFLFSAVLSTSGHFLRCESSCPFNTGWPADANLRFSTVETSGNKKKIITNLTTMLLALDPSVQWAAVSTHRSAIRVPPQNCEPPGLASIACHGHSPFWAPIPPTIRELSPLFPQLPSINGFHTQHFRLKFVFNPRGIKLPFRPGRIKM